MALAPYIKRTKKERQAIYCECIMGIISSILAIIGLILVLTKVRLDRPWAFNISFTFWICYLIFSIFIVGLGIYSAIKEKNFDKKKKQKEMKLPLR